MLLYLKEGALSQTHSFEGKRMFKRHFLEFWKQVSDAWREFSRLMVALWILTRVLARKAKRKGRRKLKSALLRLRAWSAKKVRGMWPATRKATLVAWPHVKKHLKWMVIGLVCLVGIWFFGTKALESLKIAVIAIWEWIYYVIGISVCISVLLYPGYLLVKKIQKGGFWKKSSGKTLGERWKEWLELFRGLREDYYRSWMLYPVFIYGIWFLIVFYAWGKFSPDLYAWIWKPPQHWWRLDQFFFDQPIFWAIPFSVMVFIFCLKFRRVIPIIGAIIFMLYIGSATKASYQKTPMWQAAVAREAAEQARDEEEKQVTAQNRDRKESRETGPGTWTKAIKIPWGEHYKIWTSEVCRLSIRKDGDEIMVFDYTAPLDLNFGPGEYHTVEFMSDKSVTTFVSHGSNYLSSK